VRTTAASAARTHAVDDLHMYALDGAAVRSRRWRRCRTAEPWCPPSSRPDARLVERLTAEVQRRHTVLSQQD
jgi:hypothetical protein